MNSLEDITEMACGLLREAWTNGGREAMSDSSDVNARLIAENTNLKRDLEAMDLERLRYYNEASNYLAQRDSVKEDLDKVVKKYESLKDAYRRMVNEPSPCPFCGHTPSVLADKNDSWYIACCAEDCRVNPETEGFDTETDAIRAWNRRA